MSISVPADSNIGFSFSITANVSRKKSVGIPVWRRGMCIVWSHLIVKDTAPPSVQHPSTWDLAILKMMSHSWPLTASHAVHSRPKTDCIYFFTLTHTCVLWNKKSSSMANGFGSSSLLQHSHETGPNHPVHKNLPSALTKSDLKTFASFFPIFKRSLFWDNDIILDGRLKLKPRDLRACLCLYPAHFVYTLEMTTPPQKVQQKKTDPQWFVGHTHRRSALPVVAIDQAGQMGTLLKIISFTMLDDWVYLNKKRSTIQLGTTEHRRENFHLAMRGPHVEKKPSDSFRGAMQGLISLNFCPISSGISGIYFTRTPAFSGRRRRHKGSTPGRYYESRLVPFK